MQASDTELMLKGYGLTTAEFFYRMPDYRNVLNTFVWQDYDLAPDHPRLFKFIEFWQAEIEGPLHSVRFTHRKMIAPGEWRNVVGEFRLALSSAWQGQTGGRPSAVRPENAGSYGNDAGVFHAFQRGTDHQAAPDRRSQPPRAMWRWWFRRADCRRGR